MATDNRNFSHPFGNAAGETPNVPLDVTSDMWTPISTGTPMPGPGKLTDAQSTVSPSPREEQPRPAPQKKAAKKPPEKKPGAKKRGKKAKSKPKAEDPLAQKRMPSPKRDTQAPEKQPRSGKQQRPVRQKATQVVARAGELRDQGVQSLERRQEGKRRRRRDKSNKNYQKGRLQGDSADDLRRKEAQRKRRRKKLFTILTVAVVLAVAAFAALIYALTWGTPIKEVVVTGVTAYSQQEVIDASGVMKGDNLFRVRESAVNRRLCEKLPYIGSVDVKYRLPDVLELVVTETTDKYLISGKSVFLCLDDEQKILSLKKKKPGDGQFRLDGFDDADGEIGTLYEPLTETDKKRFEAAKEIVKCLLENGLEKANVIDLSDLEKIVIRYDGRINLYLGTTKNLSIRLRAAAETLREKVSENVIGYLEITYEGKIFVKEGTMTKD